MHHRSTQQSSYRNGKRSGFTCKRACYAWNGEQGCPHSEDECRFGHVCSKCNAKGHKCPAFRECLATHRFVSFLNAPAQYVDPHSRYLSTRAGKVTCSVNHPITPHGVGVFVGDPIHSSDTDNQRQTAMCSERVFVGDSTQLSAKHVYTKPRDETVVKIFIRPGQASLTLISIG